MSLRMSPDTGEVLEDGWSAIYAAIDLWSLLDPVRAEALRRALKDRWEVEDARGERIVPHGELPELIAHLRALRGALPAITASDLTVLPGHAEAVRALAPRWFMHWREGERDIDTLSVTVGKIEEAAEFLERARDRGSAVELD